MNDNSSTFLSRLLTSTKTNDEIYDSYFKEDLWTVNEFVALMVEITPAQYEELNDPENDNVNYKDFAKYKLANQLLGRFVKDFKKNYHKEFRLIREKLLMTPRKFLKWVAMNQIAIKKRFLDALSISQLEVLLENQPLDIAIKTKPSWYSGYHKAIFQKNALGIIEKSKRKMTRDEIYHHPVLDNLRRTFKNKKGEQIRYKKRTITDVWLAEIDPRDRGRPPKHKRVKKIKT